MNNVELLAPGGSYESAIAAYNAGADAVYTAGEMFGARAGADNLTIEQLIDLMNYAHLHGKKLYLTVNTLLKEDELTNQLSNLLTPLYEAGLDAVIVQDFGVMKFVKEHFPKLHIHASTQMTVMGKDTAKFLEKYGVRRIVTPREFSFDEISDIRKNTNIEIESFVHGSLCYCYSGQCLLSSFIGGRSGNRGRCAQPCRMEYDLYKDNKILNKKDEKYILSPKDICAIKLLPDIINTGVNSLKIEGRMKKLEYIAGVVSIYRKYLDMYYQNPDTYKVSESDIQKLLNLFNRNGFSESYYKKHNGRDMMSLKKVDFRKENRELVNNIKDAYNGKKLKHSIDIFVECIQGKPFKIYTKIGEKEVAIYGNEPQSARSKPIDKDSIKKQICKLGNTDFVAENVQIILGEELFVSVGEINELRRRFTHQLKNEILKQYQRKTTLHDLTDNHTEIITNRNCENSQTDSDLRDDNNIVKFNTHCYVWNKKQLSIVLKYEFVDMISIESTSFKPEEIESAIQKVHDKNKQIYIAMPYVFRKKDKIFFEQKYLHCIQGADGVIIRNIEQYFYLQNLDMEFCYIFDYNVYTINRRAKMFVKDFHVMTTASVELNQYELKSFDCSESELIVYGYIPVMTSAGCGLKSLNKCDKSNAEFTLKDRMNYKFSVKCVCDYCYNLMYNSRPLSLFQYSDKIKELSPKSLRLIFTNETESEMREILSMFHDALVMGHNIKDFENTTRGHFLRGVL